MSIHVIKNVNNERTDFYLRYPTDHEVQNLGKSINSDLPVTKYPLLTHGKLTKLAEKAARINYQSIKLNSRLPKILSTFA